jgi:hypothetical protein
VVARYASTNRKVRVVAVSLGTRRDAVAFTRRLFGRAPVTVYWDPTGTSQRAFDAPSFPLFRYVTPQGRLTTRPPAGFPPG